jgi:hypothetical protein
LSDKSAGGDSLNNPPKLLDQTKDTDEHEGRTDSAQASPRNHVEQEPSVGEDESDNSAKYDNGSPVTPSVDADDITNDDTTDVTHNVTRDVTHDVTEDVNNDNVTESAADTSSAPPLPSEPLPAEQDDGWDYKWSEEYQAYYFFNRFTNVSTWENPRLPYLAQAQAPAAVSVTDTDNTQLQTPPATAVPPITPINEPLPAGGYNPAIHGDYDPNAWYAKNNEERKEPELPIMDPAAAYAAIGSFNRSTGRWQDGDLNPERHNDESKSRRQMNAFFDVDAAANAHDGRSLKAERSGKKPSKTELKQFKEKRRAKKEEKRRAWLRD